MRVLLLAAGYGTRLYPLTKNVAKALIPFRGTTLLNLIAEKVERLRERFPVDDVVLVSNERFFDDFMRWDEENDSCIRIINDGSRSPEEKRGAVGDIDFAVSQFPPSDWLIIGTDNFFDWELDEFVVRAKEKRPHLSVGVYEVEHIEDASRFGVVKLDTKGAVVEFKEKPKDPSLTTVAVCIYYFPRESLASLREFLGQTNKPDATGTYIEWLVEKTSVYGHLSGGRWLDVGTQDALEEMEKISEV